ncbi:MAG TPA: tetratricopeptide repeat protein [Candidatus Eisenbacteria bacterium]|nr:tetratricopeptide repeat protein [Candidatus Eisenbacteria bacterium]
MLSAALALLASSCAGDPAEREYLDALRGEEQGMTREEQITRLDRAIALAPTRAWYRELHAIYSIDLRRFDQATASLDTAIQLADRPYLRFLRGLVSCQRENYGASLPDFDLAIRDEPENPLFYRGRALARARLAMYDDAMKDAERLLALAPQQGESHYAMGVALAGLGRYRDAVRAFEQGLRLRPELIYPLEARAEALDRMGEHALAMTDREEAERRRRRDGPCAVCEDPFRY